jgi:hypothetical protein
MKLLMRGTALLFKFTQRFEFWKPTSQPRLKFSLLGFTQTVLFRATKYFWKAFAILSFSIGYLVF